jgi:hypothetical protein
MIQVVLSKARIIVIVLNACYSMSWGMGIREGSVRGTGYIYGSKAEAGSVVRVAGVPL